MITPVQCETSTCWVRNLPRPLHQLVHKVQRFIQRYWNPIVVYGAAIAASLLAGLLSPAFGTAATAGVGFFWAVGNTDGTPIAQDFLEEISTRPEDLGHFPEETEGSLGSRYQNLQSMRSALMRTGTREAPTLGWCLLHGEVGTGKSEAARWLARELKRSDRKVFKLREDCSLPADQVFNLINEACADEPTPPVIIIEEAHRFLQSGAGSWSALRNTLANPPRFNLLAVSHSLSNADPGMLSRFGGPNTGRRFEWTPLPVDDVIRVVEARSNYPHVPRLVRLLNQQEAVTTGEEGNQRVLYPPDLLRLVWQKIAELQAPGAPTPWEALRITEETWTSSAS